MATSGGNPNFLHYQFTTDRDELLIAKLSLRLTCSMLEQIRQRANWQ